MEQNTPIFSQLVTIAKNTFVESIRQPIYMIMLLAGCGWIALQPPLSAYTFGSDNKLLLQNGLSSAYLVGLLLAALTATNVITREIEQRTVLTVLSKPVSRMVFVLGKFLGVQAAILVAMWTVMMAMFLTARHGVLSTAADKYDLPVLIFSAVALIVPAAVAAWANYAHQRVFASTFSATFAIALTVAALLVLPFGREFAFQSPATDFAADGALMAGQLPLAMLMVLAGVIVLTAVAIAASTRLGQLPTVLVCLAFYLLGFGIESLVQPYVRDIPVVDRIVRLMANLQLLWPGDALASGNEYSVAYLGMAALYAALFTLAALVLAIALSHRRQLS